MVHIGRAKAVMLAALGRAFDLSVDLATENVQVRKNGWVVKTITRREFEDNFDRKEWWEALAVELGKLP